MTEAEWLVATDPMPMLEFLRGKASDRKLRLFAVACSRRYWSLYTYNQCRATIEVAERYADGLARLEELEDSFSAAFRLRSSRGGLQQGFRPDPYALVASSAADKV